VPVVDFPRRQSSCEVSADASGAPWAIGRMAPNEGAQDESPAFQVLRGLPMAWAGLVGEGRNQRPRCHYWFGPFCAPPATWEARTARPFLA